MNTRIVSAMVSLSAVLLTGAASAADRTWSGASLADSKWSSADNWGGAAPVAGDALFFAGSTRGVNTNDLAEGLALASITFNSGAGVFSLSGNGIALGGDVRNLSSSAQTLKLPLSLSGLHAFNSPGADLTVNGALSGAGGLIADATNRTVTLTASNSYDGVTYVTNGTLAISHGWSLGSTNGHTMVYGSQNGWLKISGGIEIYEPITLKGQRPLYGQTLTCNGGSNTIWGQVTKVNEIRLGGVGGSTLVFAGGIKSATGGDIVLNPGGGTFIFRDVPVTIGAGAFYQDQGGLVAIAVAGNTWGDTRAAGSTMRTDVTNALPAATRLLIGAGHATSGTFDLNGCDQTIGYLHTDTANAGTRIVTSLKPAALTVTYSGSSTYNGILSGAVRFIKNGTGSILFTNGVSTTTGDLIVNTGTVSIAQSAGFGYSSNIVVNGGILELRTATGLNDGASLHIADGGKVKVGAGLTETVDKLFVNGVQQARGTYGTTTSGALFPDNTHFDGTGQINVWSGPAVTSVTYTWDAGAGEENLFLSTPSNWEGDAAPLFDGTPSAVFGTGGLTATVDVAAGFYGITLNRNGDFTLAAGSGVITNGSGGIWAEAPNTMARTYAVTEDIVLRDNQTWVVATNNYKGLTALKVTGSIDDGLVPATLTKAEAGTLTLSANNTFDGAVVVSNGILRISNSNALGSTNGNTTIQGVAGGYLNLDGNLRLWEPLVLNGEKDNAGTIRIDSGSNTLSGPITCYNQVRLQVYYGSLVVDGGIYQADGASGGSLVINSGTATYFLAKPLILGQKTFYTDSGGLTVLGVAGNTWADTLVAGGTLRLDLPDAIPTNASVRLGIDYSPNGTLNLNGNNQTVSKLYVGTPKPGTRTVTSATPALLTVSQGSGTNTLFDAKFTGAVSLLKVGAGALTLTNAFTTTSGSFIVSNGTLMVASSGTFGPNCTNVAVSGAGTLILSNSVTIADSATVTMPAAGVGTAKISLASGVNETVRYLYFGGKQQRAGTYGASGSPAAIKDDTHFSGAGVLTVLRDDFGTLVKLQ